MTNLELFENYNTEKWVIEENLCFMLQEYWEKCNEKGYLKERQMPINPVSFVKSFMKEETLCEVEYAEKSKMETLEASEVITVPYTELP